MLGPAKYEPDSEQVIFVACPRCGPRKDTLRKAWNLQPRFMLKAISLALIENPKVNSKFGPADANPPSYTMYGSHNISVAVAARPGV